MSKSLRSNTSQAPVAGGDDCLTVEPCGDDAILIDFSHTLNANQSVRVLWFMLEASRPDFCLESVAAVSSLAVVLREDFRTVSARESCCDILMQLAIDSVGKTPPVGAEKIIPVCYDASMAPDLERVAQHTGLSTNEVIARHCAGVYLAEVMGFMPGFAYMSGLDPTLSVPRLPVPRPSVPAGALGITGQQCAVYPSATPGGWNLIGRSPIRLFDPQRSTPSFLGLGDSVRFEVITVAQFDRLWAKR